MMLLCVAQHTVQGVSQTLEETVGIAADFMDGKIGLAILPGVARSDILIVDAPSKLLAAIADSPAHMSELSCL
jgi:hypothetical protein